MEINKRYTQAVWTSAWPLINQLWSTDFIFVSFFISLPVFIAPNLENTASNRSHPDRSKTVNSELKKEMSEKEGIKAFDIA